MSLARPETFEGPCILVQDEDKGEPVVLLRRHPGAPVEELTVQQAHAAVEQAPYVVTQEPIPPAWWVALIDLLEGIR